MADDRLRISAEVTDGFTGPLAKMQTALRGIHATGSQSAGALKKDFEGAQGAISKAHGALNLMTPALTTFGLSTATAALSITGISSAIKNFTSNTQAMSMLSRETGVSIDKLRAFGALGEQFGVSASTMQGSVQGIARNMFELRRRWGEAYSGLQKMNLGDLAEQLVSAPNMEVALKRIMDKLGTIRDPEIRRRVAGLLGAEELASVAGEVGDKYEQTMADIARRLGRTTQQQVNAAKRFEGSIAELRQNLDGLRTEALAPTIEKLNDFVRTLQSPEAMAFFKKELDAITSGIGNTYKELAALVDLFNKLKSYMPGDGKDERSYGIQLNDMLRRDLGIGPRKDDGPVSAKELQRRLTEKQNEYDFNSDVSGGGPRLAAKQDELRREIGRLTEELRKAREQGGNPTASPSSFGGGGFGGGALIQNAALSGGGGALGGRRFGEAGPGAPVWGFPGTQGGRPLRAGDPGYAGGGAGGAALPGPGGALGDQPASPRGDGRGNPRAASKRQMMSYATDELRRLGVPEDSLRQSAAHLVGQAHMESGLDPNKVHDGGTGFGIYGARDPKGWGNYRGARRSNMVRWLEANGYARNSAEGQMRYMTREAMTGGYTNTRRILMGKGSGNVDFDTNAITREFEAPLVTNYRAGAVRDAYRVGPQSDAPGGMSRLRETDIEHKGSGNRPGDKLMGRLFGNDAPVLPGSGKGSLDITLNGFPAGARARASMDDLFKDVSVSKSRQFGADGI